MRRTIMLTVVAASLLVGAPAPAQGADVSRTSYTATGLPGHPQLDAGTVLDVTIGRDQGAFERHGVRGAAPATAYDLVAEVFFATACQPDDPFGPVAVPEGTLTTDERGDGHLAVRFPGDGATSEAGAALERALGLCANAAEHAHLQAKLAALRRG